MRRSFLLWLRLTLAGLRKPGPLALRAAQVERPAGPLVWLVLSEGTEADAALVARRLGQLRAGLRLRVSAPGAAPAAALWPKGTETFAAPEESPAGIARLLARWRPDLIVLVGNDLPAAVICGAGKVPVMLVDACPGAAARPLLLRGQQRALLGRLSRILTRDPASSVALKRLGADPAKVEIGGILAEPPVPLRCSDPERASIAQGLRARPVWLATAVPEAEIDTVLAAHTHALRLAHRMLLILAPDAQEDAVALAARLEGEGWAVGRRSLEGEPDAEMQVFLADDPGDYGLWYRLAPVTYMGGTFTGAAYHARSPLEPAALGSAIIHGPRTAPFTPDYTRLTEARAARAVASEAQLGEAVADLLAPDRAAILAHNAWAVTSGGAGAVEAVARAILTELDAARGSERE